MIDDRVYIYVDSMTLYVLYNSDVPHQNRPPPNSLNPLPSMRREYMRRPRHSAPNLVMYLDCQDNWLSLVLPSLSDDSRLIRARNSKKDTQDNNDLLEFIGDRVVNLACALMVEKVKYSSDHQMVRGLSVFSGNNVTLMVSSGLEESSATMTRLGVLRINYAFTNTLAWICTIYFKSRTGTPGATSHPLSP
jgi:hypothetical protein